MLQDEREDESITWIDTDGQVPLNLLYPSAHHKCTDAFVENIKENGLQHPIIILVTTTEKWEEEAATKYPQLLPAPIVEHSILQIRFGHNRVEAYRRLGKTHIPALIYTSLTEAAEEAKKQAKWYKQRYGSLD